MFAVAHLPVLRLQPTAGSNCHSFTPRGNRLGNAILQALTSLPDNRCSDRCLALEGSGHAENVFANIGQDEVC